MAKELRSYFGHVPRDRGSIWYLAPLFTDAILMAAAAFLVAAILFA